MMVKEKSKQSLENNTDKENKKNGGVEEVDKEKQIDKEKDTETKDTETKDTETKDTETKDTKDTETKDTKETVEAEGTDTKETKETDNKDTKETTDTDETKETDKKDKTDDNEVKTEIFEDGWFDETTGKIDYTKIKDETVKEAVKKVESKFISDKSQDVISRAVDDELKTNYSLSVRPETLKSMLDLSKVTIDESGKVTGVKEAIEALKADEPGLFKDKEKESNPLKEGFNPVEKGGSDKVHSFSDAFRLMEEAD